MTLSNTAPKKTAAVLALVLSSVLLALSAWFPTLDRTALSEGDTPAAFVEHRETDRTEIINDDVMWLARCIYSETKRPEEQALVAWVIRNRVETGYRGADSYEEAVLDPFQFSAFNPGSGKRSYYMELHTASSPRGWKRALDIAREVYHAPADVRPFPRQTRHFYSERSMVGGQTPDWARGRQPIRPVDVEVDPRRFRFYASIA